MNKKIGGKSFKFSSSPFPYQKPPPALSINKQSREFVLTMLFSHILMFNGTKISRIEVNEDDTHGKPDTTIVANGIEQGVQLTKLSLNDPLKRINISERQTNQLLNLFPDSIKVKVPINVYIYLNSKDKNVIPKGNIKQRQKLVDLIVKGITDNYDKIFGKNKEFVCLPINDPTLEQLASSITINSINTGHNSLFIGKNGIHINYEFDTQDWNENDLDKEIDRIINSKQGGQEDILLIWADRFEILYQDKNIASILTKKLSTTDFKEVYFLTLFDRVDQFFDSWKLIKVK